MGKQPKSAISPTRSEDYPEWYQQAIKASDMAERSPVRGCMVIKPWGYALWENIVQAMDAMFKETGVKNAYFPLFIPLSFMQKEADHVEGFAKECAVVTHHRLEKDAGGALVPAGRLTEPLVVRPTSETIIADAFSKWISSYRDLPILLNQWGNVVRWEMRTRIFLRTSEFLWQEGHTAHATQAEALERTQMMLEIYARLAEEVLAMPVIKGAKTAAERFPGAVDTLCIESMMQDCKALQAGTSHFLGQNFARASQIKFQTADEKEEYAWTTSWGASTRLIGGVIMTHGDDDGVVMPPRAASAHVVLLPIFKKEDERQAVMAYTDQLARELRSRTYYGRRLVVEVDPREIGGARGWEWIKKGIPLRVEIGAREVRENTVFFRSPGQAAHRALRAETGGVRGGDRRHSRRHPEHAVRAGGRLPQGAHGGDRRKGGFLRLLYAAQPRKARDPRRVCHLRLVRIGGMRGADQGGVDGDHSLHSLRSDGPAGGVYRLRQARPPCRIRESLLKLEA